MDIIRSKDRYTANHGWLTSRFSFSFADYQDPSNVHFGHLRVLNDDIIQPSEGFGMHPHRDMEIVTYVIDGELEHRDSLGNRGLIRPGEVQRMTAGTGIHHSEYNPSETTPLHLLQIWIFPDEKGLEPSWEQKHFSTESQRNRLLPVIQGRPGNDTDTGALRIHQDVSIYLSTLDRGSSVTFEQNPGRRIHLFVIQGKVTLNEDAVLEEGDAARITNLSPLHLRSEEGAQFMLMDLA